MKTVRINEDKSGPGQDEIRARSGQDWGQIRARLRPGQGQIRARSRHGQNQVGFLFDLMSLAFIYAHQ